MNSLEEKIEKKIVIDRHKIIIAKAYLMNLSSDEKIELALEMNRFATSQGFPPIDELKVFEENALVKASGYISWCRAFSHAALELINSNQLIPSTPYLAPNNITIRWSSAQPGHGGTKSSITFSKGSIPTPSAVLKPNFQAVDHNFTLFSPDLFVAHMEIQNAHDDVIEALYDTIDCFKKELYRPSLTMLGKAVEGAWIELGVSLADYAVRYGHDVKKNEALQDTLKGYDKIASKVEKVIQLYSSHHKDWYDDIRRETNIQSSQLAGLQNWSDLIRKSRNAIHFGVKLDTEINYEKTAVILLASIDNFKLIYALKRAADEG